MARFRYTALDASARRVQGEMEAATSDEAVMRLRSDGLTVERIEPGPEPSPPSRAARPPARLRDDEVLELGGRIAGITQAGLPLTAGLRALEAELPRGRVRRALRRVGQRLEAGESLERVATERDSVLPSPVQGVIRAGMRSGRLGLFLERYLTDARDAMARRRLVLLRMAYPALLIMLGGLVVLFYLYIVVPEFASILEGLDTDLFDIDLPLPTELLMSLSLFLRRHVVASLVTIFVGLVVLWGLVQFWSRSESSRWLLYRIPLAGRAVRAVALAEFCRLLALLIEGDEPLPSALRLAGDAMHDMDLRTASHQLAADVEKGHAASRWIRTLWPFPPELAPFFRWEGDRDAFVDALRTAAEIFDARSQTQGQLAALLYQPLAVLSIAGMIGLMVLFLYFPLLQLLNKLS